MSQTFEEWWYTAPVIDGKPMSYWYGEAKDKASWAWAARDAEIAHGNKMIGEYAKEIANLKARLDPLISIAGVAATVWRMADKAMVVGNPMDSLRVQLARIGLLPPPNPSAGPAAITEPGQ